LDTKHNLCMDEEFLVEITKHGSENGNRDLIISVAVIRTYVVTNVVTNVFSDPLSLAPEVSDD
jgi:hypothetical protein